MSKVEHIRNQNIVKSHPFAEFISKFPENVLPVGHFIGSPFIDYCKVTYVSVLPIYDHILFILYSGA